eukprot:CAMPEP_0118660836 /NCGR_PEP_ID=MMETSP0785-20121206/15923_1 /TAXON_ID=91992 /ORGANISM="Bolidomonas pacifica, Strain CCMP 1866" /LENGTH=94 /DNA_ID=CAMNT_0006554165 /DNA_START=77 /DNA_END=358 /DNA_ORIENTATION=+
MLKELGSRQFQLYLLYLYETFRRPEYARFVKFPVAFEHCRMLIHPSIQDVANGGTGKEVGDDGRPLTDYITPFARGMTDVGFRDTLHQEQFNTW